MGGCGAGVSQPTTMSLKCVRIPRNFLAGVTRVKEVHYKSKILVTLLADQGLCKEEVCFTGKQTHKKLGQLYAIMDRLRYDSTSKSNYTVEKKFENLKANRPVKVLAYI